MGEDQLGLSSLFRRVLLAAFICLIGLPLLPGAYASAGGERPGTGQIVAREVRRTALPATESAGALAVDGPGAASEVFDAGIRFGHLGVHWQLAAGAAEEDARIEFRTSLDGTGWGAWREAVEQHDLADDLARERYANPQHVGVARYAQYRLTGSAGAVTAVSLTFIDAADLNLDPLTTLVEDLKEAWRRATSPPQALAAAVTVRTRAQWGADESLMRWRPERDPWEKALVHHTVTSNSYATAAAEIRSIYYYHAVTRGWGDIGYSFLVDKYGNVWQGRAGGDDVIAGHAYGWNEGTFGVALLGDFTGVAPTPAALEATGSLIGRKFASRGIQPFGATRFTHFEQQRSGAWLPVTAESPNIIGHRDANYVAGASGGQTACPGKLLWDRLDDIRRLAQSAITSSPFYAALTVGLPGTLKAGQATNLSVVVRNQGLSPIAAASTRLGYWLSNANTGAYVGAGPIHQIGGDIRPGAARTISVPFTAPASGGLYVVNWDLQVPGNAWFADLYGTPVIRKQLAVTDLGVQWTNTATPPFAQPGTDLAVTIGVKNTGTRTWRPGEIALSYHLYDDQTGQVVAWDGLRGALAAPVAPGAQASIALRVRIPARETRYRIRYDMVWEGGGWFSDFGAPRATAYVNVGFDYRASYSKPAALSLSPGEAASADLTITNSSSRPWPASVALGSHLYDGSGRLVDWNGPRTAIPALAAGASATVPARVTAPLTPGPYRITFDLVNEGHAWFSGMGVAAAAADLRVRGALYGARYEPAAAAPLAQLPSAPSPVMRIKITNTSDFDWGRTVNLAYQLYDSAGALVTWEGLRTALPATVRAGGSVDLAATVAIPARPGTYTIAWNLVHEGVAWFSEKGVIPARQTIQVPGEHSARYEIGSRSATGLPVTLTNTGLARWRSGEIALSYHLYRNGAVQLWDGPRLRLPTDVPPGGAVSLLVPGLPQGGDVEVRFDLVREGVAWFSQLGVPTGDRPLLCAPDSWIARYYKGRALAGAPVATRCEAAIDRHLRDGTPGVGTSDHSIAWTRDLELAGGAYIVTARADDGVRVSIDGVRVIDEWRDQGATTFTATRDLAAGAHRVRVEYYQAGGDAEIEVSIAAAPAPVTGAGSCPVGQFLARYYSGRQPAGQPVAQRCESAIRYDWASGPPALQGVPADVFAARWEGDFEFSAGDHEFTARADDGVRVLVDGKQIIDAWYDQSATDHRGRIALTAGRHRVTMEFYENRGLAVAALSWAALTGPGGVLPP